MGAIFMASGRVPKIEMIFVGFVDIQVFGSFPVVRFLSAPTSQDTDKIWDDENRDKETYQEGKKYRPVLVPE
jgi:hypothetical protein